MYYKKYLHQRLAAWPKTISSDIESVVGVPNQERHRDMDWLERY